MLWNASAINGFAIEASDGRLGTVSDLLCEDIDWTLRWLVADTGIGLPGRRVLLPLSALGRPDPHLRHFPIKLTMRQVEDSPDIDTDQPVSRQTEAQVYSYYGWDPYWDHRLTSTSNAMATPFVAPLFESGPEPSDLVGAVLPSGVNNPHLRSIAAVTGNRIHAIDGEIGHVDDFLVDDTDWRIQYITVDTRNWWPGKKVLISSRSIRRIDWVDGLIHLDVDRQKVKEGPPYDPAVTVDGAYDETFLTYYGIRWAAA